MAPRHLLSLLAVVPALVVLAPVSAPAQDRLDTPDVAVVQEGHGKVRLQVTATEAASLPSATVRATTTPQNDCTYTQGYWKSHQAGWPVENLTLGTVSYDKAELVQILLKFSIRGNGLLSLAHQLIATKLNVAAGATPAEASDAIAAADALIGDLVIPPIGTGSLPPSETSVVTQVLDDYNNGVSGPGHCDTVPGASLTWGRVKTLFR